MPLTPQTSKVVELSQPEKQEIYYDGYMYDVTEWIPKHPGGNVIKYYTEENEDATIPIQQFHQRSIKQVLAKMKTLKRREATLVERPTQTNTRYLRLDQDFQNLYVELQAEGFFEPSLYNTFLRVLEILVLFCLSFYFGVSAAESMVNKYLTIICITLFGVRSSFLMHEGGHGSLTGIPNYDRAIEAVFIGLGAGFSSSWWSRQHNRHHAMPQRLDRDVDLSTLPILAFNSKIANPSKSGNNFFTRNQAVLFLSIDNFLIALFWGYWISPKYAIKNRLYGQLFIMVSHSILLISLAGLPGYLLATWLGSNWLLGTFTLSHSHMPITTEKLHWVEYSLLHTTNIHPSWWCDWVMGYLNYQIEHHLFPTMPQFRQRQIADRVKALALKHDIPYQCMSYTEGIRRAISNLSKVSDEIKEYNKYL